MWYSGWYFSRIELIPHHLHHHLLHQHNHHQLIHSLPQHNQHNLPFISYVKYSQQSLLPSGSAASLLCECYQPTWIPFLPQTDVVTHFWPILVFLLFYQPTPIAPTPPCSSSSCVSHVVCKWGINYHQFKFKFFSQKTKNMRKFVQFWLWCFMLMLLLLLQPQPSNRTPPNSLHLHLLLQFSCFAVCECVFNLMMTDAITIRLMIRLMIVKLMTISNHSWLQLKEWSAQKRN